MRNHSSGGRDRGRDRNLIPVRRNFRRQHASSPSHHFQSSFLISLDILWIFFFFLSQPAFLPFLSPSILAPFSPMHSLSLSLAARPLPSHTLLSSSLYFPTDGHECKTLSAQSIWGHQQSGNAVAWESSAYLLACVVAASTPHRTRADFN